MNANTLTVEDLNRMEDDAIEARHLSMSDYVVRLVPEIRRLRSALEFYAAEDNWIPEVETVQPPVFASRYIEEEGRCRSVVIQEPFEVTRYRPRGRLVADRGRKAQEALK